MKARGEGVRLEAGRAEQVFPKVKDTEMTAPVAKTHLS